MRIRHYGILANRAKREKLAAAESEGSGLYLIAFDEAF